jgi:cystathionine beta-lyase family protein involved in aluminum resistance
VGRAVHPALKDGVGSATSARSPSAVLAEDAPVVAKALKPRADTLTAIRFVTEVILLNHLSRMGAGSPSELGVHAQRSKAPVIARSVVQAEGTLFLGFELYRSATASLDGGGCRPALSGSTAEAKKAALPAKIMAPRTAVAYLITMENPPPLVADATLAQFSA